MTEQTFKVGDEVIIVNSRGRFAITTDGSRGVIVDYDYECPEYLIHFTHLTTDFDSEDYRDFHISPQYLELVEQKPIKEQVIDKIKALENNFKQRGKQNEMSMLR